MMTSHGSIVGAETFFVPNPCFLKKGNAPQGWPDINRTGTCGIAPLPGECLQGNAVLGGNHVYFENLYNPTMPRF